MNAQQRAEAHDRERERLVRAGMRAAGTVSLRLRAAVIRAYRSGGSIEQAIRDALSVLRSSVLSGMTAAHLQGELRSGIDAQKAAGKGLADPFRSAIDYLKKRAEASPDRLSGIASAYAGDTDKLLDALGGNLADKVNLAILESARAGDHVGAGIERIRAACDAAGVGPKSDFAVETLYRTQVQTAYSAGKWQADQDPAVQEILWGYEYVTVGDDRVRPSHAAMNGFRAPKDDPIWRTIAPPGGWGCRCTLVSIFNDERIAVPSEPLPATVTIDGVQVVPGPDEGWDFNPGEVYRALAAAGG